jgi:hypothetical protein
MVAVMPFQSILFDRLRPETWPGTPEAPVFLGDLNLDQIIDTITLHRQDYELKDFFYTPLHDVETIRYRQEIMQDLEDGQLLAHIKEFAAKMTRARRCLNLRDKLEFNYHQKGWFLEAALEYCAAVDDLAQSLDVADLHARGWLALRVYVETYRNAPEFQKLAAQARVVKEALASVTYCLTLHYDTVKVQRYEGEVDYSLEVDKTFEKFKQGVVKDYRLKLNYPPGPNHIEARILEFVAKLYPDQFATLNRFCEQYQQFMDPTLLRFVREVQFYVAYLDYIADLKKAGLPFCYPQLVTASKDIYSQASFDIALAHKRVKDNAPVISNDFYLHEPERILVISGPNQGGKTTFARTFGQLHYLASLGCPVAGQAAQLFLGDQIFTHFEKEEDLSNLRSKLEDDLMRIHASLAQATPNSLFILNEMFASTTLSDAAFLSEEIMKRMIELDALGVWVTFISELASYSAQTVSMVSVTQPDNPAVRTFKIVRKPADGLAYALSLAEKHRLTYTQLRERIQG